MNLHLMRWAFLRFNILRGLLILIFCIYSFVPDQVAGKSFVNYLAIGHLTGAFSLAVPAYVFFFLTLPLVAMYANGQQINLDTEHSFMTKYFSALFYLCALSAILIITYFTHTYSKNDWSVWLTTSIAIIEIVYFAWRGTSKEKKMYFFHHFKSSALLYGAIIFIAIKHADSTTYSIEEYYIPVALFHLLAEIFFMPINMKKK